MRIRFWGVRGTIPVPGQETVKYGGNTPCLDILTSDQQVIIIDAGTGIRNLGRVLQEEHPRHIIGKIFLSTRHEGVDFSETVLNLAHGSDLLIHDAHFASRKLSTTFTDWGHSNWYEAACLARETNVKTLGLFHYSPDLVDEELDQIHNEVRSFFHKQS